MGCINFLGGDASTRGSRGGDLLSTSTALLTSFIADNTETVVDEEDVDDVLFPIASTVEDSESTCVGADDKDGI